MTVTLRIMQRLKHAPGTAGVVFATYPCPGFGLVVMVSRLPVDAFDAEWLTQGPGTGRRRFTNRGEFLWDWLHETAILAHAEAGHPIGDMVGLMLHPAAITDAHQRLIDQPAGRPDRFRATDEAAAS